MDTSLVGPGGYTYAHQKVIGKENQQYHRDELQAQIALLPNIEQPLSIHEFIQPTGEESNDDDEYIFARSKSNILFRVEGERVLFTDMIRKIFDDGVLLTIGSDDPAYMGLNWVQDSLILVAEKCHFTKQGIALEENGVKISWATDDVKQKIMKEIKDVHAAWS